MIITNAEVEYDEIFADMMKFARMVPGFSTRVKCESNAGHIMQRAIDVCQKCCLEDLKAHDACLVEEFMMDGSGQGSTADLVLLKHQTKEALIVDWKFVQRTSKDREWRYKMGPQPVLYTILVKELYPEYDVTFENRFVVDKIENGDTAPEVVRVKLGDAELERWKYEIALRRSAIKMYNESGHWPRVANACHSFRSACMFQDKCWGQDEAEERKPLKVLQITQSLISSYDRCPSFYYNILKEAEDKGEDFHSIEAPNHYMLWGTMFHDAIAKLYEQVIEQNPQPNESAS